MENKEYYTPDLEDLFVGYECERYEVINSETLYVDKFFSYNDREQKALKEEVDRIMKAAIYNYVDYKITDLNEGIDLSKLRTKFLSKEDIEKEGWEIHREDKCLTKEVAQNAFNSWLFLELRFKDKEILITASFENSWGATGWKTIYSGKCPSINEFRKICKWLNIK